MKRIKVKKGEILQREGQMDSKVYHVLSGLLRSYSIDKNGRENIFTFAPEGWTIADHNGPDTPTELLIDAIEDSTVVVRTKDVSSEARNVGPIIRRMEVLQKRVILLLSTNAIERYEHFIQTYPDIAKRVPQKMIASYLGVTPETLSAAKKAWLKNSDK